MTKKTAIKILILVIILALGVVGYIVFFQGNTQEENNELNLPNQPESNFFPESENFDPESNNQQENNNNSNNNTVIPKLRQISQNPVAGYVLLDRSASSTNTLSEDEVVEETETVYRYVNRSNGNILETTSKKTNTDRLTNRTIPKVYESLFSEDGENLIFRYLDNRIIETNIGNIINNSTSTVIGDEGNFATLETSFLPRNIKNVVVYDDSVFYTIPGDFGLNGFLFDFNNQNQTLVFGSQITQLEPKWVDENTLLFGTKPSDDSEGYLFEYNINSRELRKILDGGNSFNFIPKENSNLVLYSNLEGSQISSYVFNREDLSQTNINLNTIVSDKCVWSNTRDNIVYCAEPINTIGLGYPDVWYQGRVFLTDNLYEINTETGVKNRINLEGSFDITNIKISDNDEYITFINKKDLTLWSLDIK